MHEPRLGHSDDRPAQKSDAHQEGLIRANAVPPCDYHGPLNVKECTCRTHVEGSNKSALTGSCSCKRRSLVATVRKSCLRFAAAFAADCTALCCCPCAIFPLLARILVEVPSTTATRLKTRLKKAPSMMESDRIHYSSRDNTHSIVRFTRSSTEVYRDGNVQAVHTVRFDSENLLKHFGAECVDFGCLILKEE